MHWHYIAIESKYLLKPFIKAADANKMDLLYPTLDSTTSDKADFSAKAPCGRHYLKFTGFKKPVIGEAGNIDYIDIEPVLT